MAKLGRVPVLCAILLLRLTFALGTLECEDLSIEDCAFAVSSTGARCVLEKSKLSNGQTTTICQTSIIMAEKSVEWIETDECIKSCGLERVSYGLSTDALMERGFTDKLCSAECQNNCPNIVDLYVKLAAGEGVYLPHLCTSQKSRSRRLIADPVQVARSVTTSGSSGFAGRDNGDLWTSSANSPAPAPGSDASVPLGQAAWAAAPVASPAPSPSAPPSTWVPTPPTLAPAPAVAAPGPSLAAVTAATDGLPASLEDVGIDGADY